MPIPSLHKSTAIRATAVALSFALTAACVNVDFQEPVGKFTSSMSTANAVIGTYFTQMNDFERRVYLQQALYDPSIAIGAVDANGRPTGLLPVFSAESIKARSDALALLTAYGERLAALAGADAPSRFNAGSAVLGTNLSNLAATFQQLAAGGNETSDSTAAAYVGPISTIVGIFGEMILDAQRDQALIRAVNDGAPAVNRILDQIEADLNTVIDPLQETGLLQQLNAARLHYNSNRQTMPFSDRQNALERIDVLALRYQAAVTARPSEAVDGIRDAHAALVTYANSRRRAADLTALASAIETFNNRLRPIVENLRRIEEAD